MITEIDSFNHQNDECSFGETNPEKIKVKNTRPLKDSELKAILEGLGQKDQLPDSIKHIQVGNQHDKRNTRQTSKQQEDVEMGDEEQIEEEEVGLNDQGFTDK